MELKELESKIQALLKNENVRVCSDYDILVIEVCGISVTEITLKDFKIRIRGVQTIYTSYDKESLYKRKEATEVSLLLLDDDVEKQLKALIKEYIQ